MTVAPAGTVPAAAMQAALVLLLQPAALLRVQQLSAAAGAIGWW